MFGYSVTYDDNRVRNWSKMKARIWARLQKQSEYEKYTIGSGIHEEDGIIEASTITIDSRWDFMYKKNSKF